MRMPAGGNSSKGNNLQNTNNGMNNNPRFAPRRPQQFRQQSQNGGMPAGQQGMNNNGNNRQQGGARFAPRGPQRFGMNQGPMPMSEQGGSNNNFGRRQDPRYVTPQDNITYEGQGNGQDPRYAPRNSGAGRRPVGLPNQQLRKPGSGGSRVMSRPTMGRMKFNRSPQNNNNNALSRYNKNKLDNSGY